MDNQDKIWELLKSAADNQKPESFKDMEAVWTKIEEKLDQEEKPKAVSLWPKWLAAASLLLVIGTGTLFFLKKEKTIQTVTKIEKTPININTETTENQKDTISTNIVASTSISKIQSKNSRKPSKIHISDFSNETGKNNEPLALADKPELLAPAPSITTNLRMSQKEIASSTMEQTQNLDETVIVANGIAKKKSLTTFKVSDTINPSRTRIHPLSGQIAERRIASKNLDTSKLSEVVVVGYGSQKRSEITGAISPNQETNDLSNSLQGHVSGLRIEPSSSSKIQIRGANSMNEKNAPIIVINGKISSSKDFQSLNNNDISSVHILKESEATSLYGSRAANGAIIITTKQPGNFEIKDDTESYKENSFTSPIATPFSAFPIDVNNSSYYNVRRFINNGQKVPKNVIHIEEMINFFPHHTPPPSNNDPYNITTEYGSAPWNMKHKLLKISIKGKTTQENDNKIIAKDVRIEVEFNPAIVKAYRLIGYEKPQPKDQDFTNEKDAGDMKSGHSVTALYEIIPIENFQKTNISTNELGAIKTRYKDPASNASIEKPFTVANHLENNSMVSEDYRLATSVAWFGLILRDSQLIPNKSKIDLLNWAKGGRYDDTFGFIAEFLRLIENAK